MSAPLKIEVSNETLTRLDEFANVRRMSREEVIQQAIAGVLEFDSVLAGEPLTDWQRKHIEEGIAAADRGEFASPEEVERILRKYGE